MNTSRRMILAAGGLGIVAAITGSRVLRNVERQRLADALPATRVGGEPDVIGGCGHALPGLRIDGDEGLRSRLRVVGDRRPGVRPCRSCEVAGFPGPRRGTGCNFVDTAMVYGDAEEILGEFLAMRRGKWLIATKYSGQKPGLGATLDAQLRRLRTDTIDFYQIHWAPGRDEQALYEDLYRAKKAGKVRAIGVSLKSEQDIDYVLDHSQIDGFQLKFGLPDPYPFLAQLTRIREFQPAIVVRSSLREGFLTGKFDANSTFTDPSDQRSKLTRTEIRELVVAAERPLSRCCGVDGDWCGTLSVIVSRGLDGDPGKRSRPQAQANFGAVPGPALPGETMRRIYLEQQARPAFAPAHAVDWVRRGLRR